MSVDSTYRFSGAYISEKVLPNTSCHCIRHFGGHVMQNGGHLQSNTSISDTKRRRAFKFDSMSRFCGAWISEKVLPNTPCHCIHHFRGDLKKHGGHFLSSTSISETKRY